MPVHDDTPSTTLMPFPPATNAIRTLFRNETLMPASGMKLWLASDTNLFGYGRPLAVVRAQTSDAARILLSEVSSLYDAKYIDGIPCYAYTLDELLADGEPSVILMDGLTE